MQCLVQNKLTMKFASFKYYILYYIMSLKYTPVCVYEILLEVISY